MTDVLDVICVTKITDILDVQEKCDDFGCHKDGQGFIKGPHFQSVELCEDV